MNNFTSITELLPEISSPHVKLCNASNISTFYNKKCDMKIQLENKRYKYGMVRICSKAHTKIIKLYTVVHSWKGNQPSWISAPW